ncbi:MAG: T9SS type A sorting domain-containing protein [bacterium]|nr:T9SS type A sorting domain-containing protein [bacterium]
MKTVTLFAIFLLFATAGVAQTCDDTLFVPYENYFYGLGCVEFCVNDNGSRTICFGPFPAYCATQFPYVSGLPVVFWPGETCPNCNRWDIDEVVWDWQEVSGLPYLCGTAQELAPPHGTACFWIDDYLGNWGTYDCWLPAELMSFNAVSVADGIKITFATASETDLNYFEIVREHNGNTQIIEQIDAENSATGNHYSYLDRDVSVYETYRYYLRTVDLDGSVEEHVDHAVTVTYSPGVQIPGDFALSAYPNPFNPSTSFTFALAEAGSVELHIFDATGRIVQTLVNDYVSAGEHTVDFDASGLSSGAYFAQLRADNTTRMAKLVLLK